MQTDKEQDNGINIKFGPERAAKGEYRLVGPAPANGKKKRINGTTHRANKKAAAMEGEMVPPDGGWGWFVLVAAVMVNVLIPGGIKSFGVIYKAFLSTYNAKATLGAWIPALCYFLYSSLGPLSSVLSVRYSYRTVTLVGGTFAAAGMMLSYFATSIEYLYISYGVFVGIGAGLAFPPTVYIVTSYFVRLRGLANGFCISGSSLGSIILPPVLTKMLEVYDVSDTILIMGALTLNVWACALLYEPVEKHMIPAKLNRDAEEALEPLAEAEADLDETLTSPEEDATRPRNLLLASAPVGDLSSGNGDVKVAAPIVPKSASSVALENYYKPTATANSSRIRKISVPVSGREIAGQMHSTPALHAVPESNRLSRRPRAPVLSPSSSSFNYISTPYHGSTLTALQPEYASTLTLNAISSTFRKSPEKQPKQQDEEPRNRFFDCELLRDPMYLVILISNSTNAISYTNFVIVLTLYAVQLGFSDNQASVLLSIVSLFDLTGRIGGAALSDTKLMPKHWYFVGGLFISGVSLAILPVASSFIMVAVYCSVFGLASGVYVGVTAVVMADMLGVEKLTSSYGISLFVNGVLQLVGPPICGALEEHLGGWGRIFTALGIILVAGASLWGFVPFIRRRQIARREAAQPEKL
ncbi:PREDICTED: monocarboxylate transporter 13 [Ceratosolen solmsi marchali]|uniref:Monocarboxylate transporter 13 n=1 Tax=Ceratosolen solmsi marchali TaxID=326594 RepID=A0AAJ7DX11_9HYME|nr:PREDICTED: monocarboxylate transporter 13 [Ceratosolen solmsi marchali]